MTTALFPDLIVNGERVAQTQIAAEAQNQTAPKGKPGLAWRKAARAVAIRTLLLQEAARRKLVPEPEQIGPGRFETDEEALIRGLLDQAVDVSAPRAEDIKREWNKDPARFRSPPLWEVSHILCACDPRREDERVKALERIKTIMTIVQSDPRGFPAVAARESDCGSGTAHGALGQLGPGETVPEFEAALRELKEGETTSEPVLTRHGYHIIRLDAFAEGQSLPFEAVREKIAQAMEKASWVRQSQHFVNQLVENSEIEGADFSIM